MQGPGPSARYAHTLALVANRFLVAMGGNDGKQTLSDAWALDTSDKPYQWRKITDAGETPSPRSVQAGTSYTGLGLLILRGKLCVSLSQAIVVPANAGCMPRQQPGLMGCCCCVAGGMLRGFPWEMRTAWQGTGMGVGSGLLLQVCSSSVCRKLVKCIVQAGEQCGDRMII